MKQITADELRCLCTCVRDGSRCIRCRCADALDAKDEYFEEKKTVEAILAKANALSVADRIAQLETVIRLLGRCHSCDGRKEPTFRPGVPCSACNGTGVVLAASEVGVTL